MTRAEWYRNLLTGLIDEATACRRALEAQDDDEAAAGTVRGRASQIGGYWIILCSESDAAPSLEDALNRAKTRAFQTLKQIMNEMEWR